MELIPIDQCKHRGVYRIECRNLGIGVYDEETKGFTGIRSKFGSQYLFEEYHWDTGAPHGTVDGTEYLHQLPDDIELKCNVHFEMSMEEYSKKRDIPISVLKEDTFPRKMFKTYQPLFDYLNEIESD